MRKKDTAASIGSGALSVYGTPTMIAMMEKASVECIKNSIKEGYSSVGVEVNVKHLSASPVGIKIRTISEVTNISDDGKFISFKVMAYDEKGLIGEGTHVRAIVFVEKFLSRCQSKLE